MTRTLLHVGYAKTATTYLQRHVFPKARGITYLGKPYDLGKGRLETFLERRFGLRTERVHPFDPFFEYEDTMRVAPPGTLDMGGLAAHLRGILSGTDLNVWSHEGYLRPGRKSSALERRHAIANLRDVLVAAGSTEVHALVVLRDTRSMMISHAVQFHRDFDYLRIGDLPLDEVVAFREGRRDDPYAALFWRLWYAYLDYLPMLEDLAWGLGADRVHVLRYEEMTADWGLLEDLLRGLHAGIRCRFPARRENTSDSKPYGLSAPLQAYVDSLQSFDPRRLYPGNYESLAPWIHRPGGNGS